MTLASFFFFQSFRKRGVNEWLVASVQVSWQITDVFDTGSVHLSCSIQNTPGVAISFYYYSHWFSIPMNSQVHLILTASPHKGYYLDQCSQQNVLTSDEIEWAEWAADGRTWKSWEAKWNRVDTVCFQFVHTSKVFRIILRCEWKSMISLCIRSPHIEKRAKLEKQYSLNVAKSPVWCS